MVESTEVAVPLTRDFIPELLRVAVRGGDESGASWNVVESLELLLDAGAFKDAGALVSSVVEMLGDDRRNRLFRTYGELCELMQGSPFRETLGKIEALAIEIEHGGFSNVDRCWSSIILARALLVGVYCRALPENEVLRARTILSKEFAKGAEATNLETCIKVGLELARSYVHVPSPELPAAGQILERLVVMSDSPSVSAEVSFDVVRMLFYVSPDSSDRENEAQDRLRKLAHPLGGVARGLAELAIARSSSGIDAGGAEALEKAISLFEESSYRSGEFEAAVALASWAAEREHYAKAHRFFARAERAANEGGFLYGRGVALLGSFHGAVASNDLDAARVDAEKLRVLANADLFMSAFGLNTVAAHQLLGKGSEAVKLAIRCERLFVEQGSHGPAGQAAFMLGASYAEAGKWKMARSAWKRALTCDELRRNYLGACERRAALAQAIAMVKFVDSGVLDEATQVEVERLLQQSERVLAPYGSSMEALQCLGKVLHIHAQLAILAKTPLNALKYLSRARESFVQLGLEREVALTDGLTGLALLEASKQGGARLLEEAMMALQRALEYFLHVGQPRLTWKLRYYLAVSALMRSQQGGDALQRESFRQMAVSFLEEATIEAVSCVGEPGMPRSGSGEGDFSPGLQPEVIDHLKKALGLSAKPKGKGRSSKEGPENSKRYSGYVH